MNKNRILKLLIIPALFLSSCSKTVDYDTYLEKAKEAANNAKEVYISKRVIDCSGTMKNTLATILVGTNSNSSYNFRVHLEYNASSPKAKLTLDQSSVVSDATEEYVAVIAKNMALTFADTVATNAEKNQSYTYTIDPLSYSTDTSKSAFDEYGNAAFYDERSENLRMKITVSNTYKQI